VREREVKALATSLVLFLATLALLGYQQGIINPSPSASPPRLPAAASEDKLRLGVTTAPLARNWWAAWTQSDLDTVSTFERQAGKAAAIVMWYADWQHNAKPLVSQLNAIENRGSMPEITWEPWDASKGLYKSQPRYRLTNIVDGRFDSYIWTWARSLAAWKHPVRLRFAQEMDGNWFPWSDYANGNHPAEFVHAWRHVHRIFELAGATNVEWVWSSAFSSAATFPGARYVNVLATTCQNGGERLFARGWQSFDNGCGKAITRAHALAPGLPIQLAEVASAEAGGSKAKWITQMWTYLARHPEVTSIVWFDIVKETDWRINSSASAQRAFADGTRAARII
jgi:glycosyl hydrolase family 26